jgi:hypothetical protein
VAVVRTLVLVLLLVAGGSFAFYAFTGQVKYRRFGLVVLKWTLLAALAFFAVMFIDRVAG